MNTDLNDNDVLLGRGLGPLNYRGNKNFQRLIRTRKQEYMSLHSSKRKRIIAQTLYDEIGRRGGRFLARVDTGRRIKDVVKEGVWEEVPKKVGLKKQALRERKWPMEDDDQKADEKTEEIPTTNGSEQQSPRQLPPEMKAPSEASKTNPITAPITKKGVEEGYREDHANNEYDDAISESCGRTEALALEMNAALDGTLPEDPHQILDFGVHEESDQSLSERPANLLPVLPSMLVANEKDCALDDRLELFRQTTPQLGSPQPMATTPHSATAGTDTMPIPGTASFLTTNPQCSLHNTVPIGESMEVNEHQRDPLQDLSETFLTTIGFGVDQPRFTDQDEELEMAALTDEENAARLADLFGKKCSLGATPHQKRQKRDLDKKTVSFLVEQMRNEIERMPVEKKDALMEARVKCRNDEFSDERLELFLRSEGMNATLAADRFVQYWSCRRELFGPDKFAMQITLNEALRDDLVALQSGFHYLLPLKDASGRRIIFRDPSCHTRIGYTSDSAVRAFWYLTEIITRESGYDGGGFVLVVWLKNTTMWDYDRYVVSKLIHYIHNALPIKAMPTHACCPGGCPLVLRRVVKPILLSLMSRTQRSRRLIHEGSESEVLQVLSSYGLDKSMLPTEVGGTVKLNLSEWIANRRAIEMEEI